MLFAENVELKVKEIIKYVDSFSRLSTSNVVITEENSHLILGTVKHHDESKRRGQTAYWSPFAQQITDSEYNRMMDKLPPIDIKVWEICQPDKELANAVYEEVVRILDSERE